MDNKMGVGLIVMQDRTGNNKNTEVQATYAYRIEFKKQVLSFGLQTGFLAFKSDNSDLNPFDADDPVFAGNQSYTKPAFGAGVILSSERYFAGLSVPRMLNAKVSVDDLDADLYQQHFYLTGAYIIFLTERIRLKPSVLFRGVKGAPISSDLNFSANFDEQITAGIFTRNFNTFGLLGQLKLKDHYRLGYAFELPTNQSVGARYTSHEFTVGVNLSLFSFHSTSMTNF
jgi:type IX secretion system PorP/SprF family membrane protein